MRSLYCGSIQTEKQLSFYANVMRFVSFEMCGRHNDCSRKKNPMKKPLQFVLKSAFFSSKNIRHIRCCLDNNVIAVHLIKFSRPISACTPYFFNLNTSYLIDSYICFTLKMESVTKNTIFGLKIMVKSGQEKFILKSLHAER